MNRRYSRRLAAHASISPPVSLNARLGLSPVINCGLSKSCKGAQKSKETLLVRKTASQPETNSVKLGNDP